MTKYNRKISVTGIVISYFNKNIHLLSETSEIKNSLNLTLSKMFETEVSGNILWKPLDIQETSYNLNVIFLGLIDNNSIISNYSFKNNRGKLTVFEQLAIDSLRKEIKDLNPAYISSVLGETFLIRDLYYLYKFLVNEKKDRANFYKLVRKKDYIVPVGRRKREVYHRPPEYYKIR